MSSRVFNICFTVYGVFLVLSFLLLSVPGGYWAWYSVMVPFSVVPLCFGRRWYRIAGGVAFLVAAVLIIGDIQAGKIYRQRMQRMRETWAERKGKPVEAP
jgi:hypothetical protein